VRATAVFKTALPASGLTWPSCKTGGVGGDSGAGLITAAYVFNRLVGLLTRMGLNIAGSRVLEVKGAKAAVRRPRSTSSSSREQYGGTADRSMECPEHAGLRGRPGPPGGLGSRRPNSHAKKPAHAPT
jgi:hypothetical protein